MTDLVVPQSDNNKPVVPVQPPHVPTDDVAKPTNPTPPITPSINPPVVPPPINPPTVGPTPSVPHIDPPTIAVNPPAPTISGPAGGPDMSHTTPPVISAPVIQTVNTTPPTLSESKPVSPPSNIDSLTDKPTSVVTTPTTPVHVDAPVKPISPTVTVAPPPPASTISGPAGGPTTPPKPIEPVVTVPPTVPPLSSSAMGKTPPPFAQATTTQTTQTTTKMTSTSPTPPPVGGPPPSVGGPISAPMTAKPVQSTIPPTPTSSGPVSGTPTTPPPPGGQQPHIATLNNKKPVNKKTIAIILGVVVIMILAVLFFLYTLGQKQQNKPKASDVACWNGSMNLPIDPLCQDGKYVACGDIPSCAGLDQGQKDAILNSNDCNGSNYGVRLSQLPSDHGCQVTLGCKAPREGFCKEKSPNLCYECRSIPGIPFTYCRCGEPTPPPPSCPYSCVSEKEAGNCAPTSSVAAGGCGAGQVCCQPLPKVICEAPRKCVAPSASNPIIVKNCLKPTTNTSPICPNSGEICCEVEEPTPTKPSSPTPTNKPGVTPTPIACIKPVAVSNIQVTCPFCQGIK